MPTHRRPAHCCCCIAAHKRRPSPHPTSKSTSSGREVPLKKFPFDFVFQKKNLTFQYTGGATGFDRDHHVVLDASKSPSTIDIREVQGGNVTLLGIYKFEDGKLMLCWVRSLDGQPTPKRPSKFESTREHRSSLVILKRKPN